MKKTLTILALLLVAAFGFYSCQSDAGLIAQDAFDNVRNGLTREYQDRSAELLAIGVAEASGEISTKEALAAALRISEDGLKSAFEQGLRSLEAGAEALKAEARAIPHRVPGAIGEAAGVYLGGGGLLGALAVLVDRIFFERRRREKNNRVVKAEVKAEVHAERNEKYIVPGPYAQPGPQMQFQTPPPPAQTQWVDPNTGHRQGFAQSEQPRT